MPASSNRLTLIKLLLMVLACAMLLGAIREFPFQASTPTGAGAALFLAAIGAAVGSVIAPVTGANYIAAVISLITCWSAMNGQLKGDTFLLWSFSALMLGMFVGLAWNWNAPELGHLDFDAGQASEQPPN